ncbi:MAG: hypothetical protein U1E65_17960 [Myxococcota bacterium]
MSASGLGALRAEILAHGSLGKAELSRIRWEIGGFRDHQEQSELLALGRDVVDGKIAVDPELRHKLDAYVARGEDGFEKRALNASIGIALGLGGALAVGTGLFSLAPSVVMYLVANWAVHQLALPAAAIGAVVGTLWDN